jgi:hypothetical protein
VLPAAAPGIPEQSLVDLFALWLSGQQEPADGYSGMPDAAASTTRVRMLCVLFFFSGLPALIYQLTRQRSLFRIFGVNTESVTAFMLGLGLGSLAGG